MLHTFAALFTCGAEELQVTTGSSYYAHAVTQSLVTFGLEELIYDRVGVRKEGALTGGFILPLLGRP